jgi:hypothetical protein
MAPIRLQFLESGSKGAASAFPSPSALPHQRQAERKKVFLRMLVSREGRWPDNYTGFTFAFHRTENAEGLFHQEKATLCERRKVQANRETALE